MLTLWSVRVPSLLFLFSWIFASWQDTPASCVSNSRDLVSLAKCLDTFTILPKYYDEPSYHDAQPTDSEREAWTTAVASLLSVDGNCTSLAVPPELEGTYVIRRFVPPGLPTSYCILVENSADCNGMPRGWGHLVVPEKREQVSRFLHVSAPHPKYDLGTIEQATVLFELSGAKSLLFAGRTRGAFMQSSTCVQASNPYWKTDPAHNNLEPFFDAFVAIYQWQQQQGGCYSKSCAFIQVHGKGGTTCPLDQIFLSTGLGNDPWYTDPTDYPVKRLKTSLKQIFPTWNISLPSDSKCPLVASGNIGGRYINSVPKSKVCLRPAIPHQVKGEFIHIEQAIESRKSDVYEAWGKAVRETFEPVCAPGMAVHPRKPLCVDGVVAEEARAWPWGYLHSRQGLLF
ncbi:hypothetical protein FA13DRAFT_1739678 [Coprinellus micaceus]|uniref:Uncharacterized protein n=1 Tax=Coprinellus micaceus TaxID=71717 RepID=A0A4Y7SRJ2_COPMI|nr:hypothetical protein FA13DRAFT_1739678 [Coprinellus micaceus]